MLHTWQMDCKCAAGPRSALHRNLPVHCFYDALRQGQAQPGAMNLCGRHGRATIKRFEDMSQFLGSYSDAAIRDADLDFFPGQSVLSDPRVNSNPLLLAAV